VNEHETWLKGLKAGDTVGVEYDNPWSGTAWTKTTVKKVTPTGVVVLADDTRYKDGFRRDGAGFHRISRKLVPWTEDIDRTIRHNEMVEKVRFYLDRSNTDQKKVEAMTDGDLLKLLNLLRTLKAAKS
jgi:hypothetical protein